MVRPAVSLGGVETTICAPAVTSHAKMSPEERTRIGVTNALLRLSVGIEHVEDLLEDMEQALASNFSAGALDGITVDDSALMSDIHASSAYRANLVKVMTGRAVEAAIS